MRYGKEILNQHQGIGQFRYEQYIEVHLLVQNQSHFLYP